MKPQLILQSLTVIAQLTARRNQLDFLLMDECSK